MKVEEHDLLPVRFAYKQLLERPHGRIDARNVVAVVVVRTPVLPLVAILHAVLVHERHEHAVGVVADPFALRRAGEDFVDDSLHDRIRRRLAGVVAGGVCKKPLRLSLPTRDAQQLRVAAAALRLAEHVELHAVFPAPANASRIPVLLQIRNRRCEARLGLVRRKGVVERVLRFMPFTVLIQPPPRFPAVPADRWAERGKVVVSVLRELEMETPPRRTGKSEVPVEPVTLCVAQVGPQHNDVRRLVDLIDLDVSAWIVRPDFNRRIRDANHRHHGGCKACTETPRYHKPFLSCVIPYRNRHGRFQLDMSSSIRSPAMLRPFAVAFTSPRTGTR